MAHEAARSSHFDPLTLVAVARAVGGNAAFVNQAQKVIAVLEVEKSSFQALYGYQSRSPHVAPLPLGELVPLTPTEAAIYRGVVNKIK